ncbi:MAG TPA: 50S ribosomal protein L35 [Candidatus Paceibacterota bacterium]|nr:50S ribosomal protein L35 [Candidatus Paceibacterota bacterium]
MKTNKSFLKRLRVTRKGKIIARNPGHNHFNAKRSGSEKMHKNRASSLEMTAQNRSRYLAK